MTFHLHMMLIKTAPHGRSKGGGGCWGTEDLPLGLKMTSPELLSRVNRLCSVRRDRQDAPKAQISKISDYWGKTQFTNDSNLRKSTFSWIAIALDVELVQSLSLCPVCTDRNMM